MTAPKPPKGAGRPPLPQYVREWLRWRLANCLSWPLWQVKTLGDKADALQARILWWGEKASPERSEHLAWWRANDRPASAGGAS